MNTAEIIKKYCEYVINGDIPACKWTVLACKRHLNDLAKSESDPNYPFYFDEDAADRICRFVGALPHVKGKWAGQPIKLEPWQRFCLGVPFGWKRRSDNQRRFREAYIEVPRKNAKDLSLDTPIPTPSGWTTMGELKVGDQVFDEKGNPTTVVATSEIFRNNECYRITFSDGATVVAGSGHLWAVNARRTGRTVQYRRDNPSAPSSLVVLTTEQISVNHRIPRYDGDTEANYSIRVAGPLQTGPDAALPMPPYALGAWLGDGTSACSELTNAFEDADILEHIRNEGLTVELKHTTETTGVYRLGYGPETYRDRETSLQAILRKNDLLNNKHIPGTYLRASVAQRFALLQGLMDTDGTALKSGQAVFSNMNHRLAKDVLELIRSLGFKPTWRLEPAYCDGKYCGDAFNIQFWPYADNQVFRLRRKQERLKPNPGKATRAQTRQIIKVEKVPTVPTRCIQVAAASKLFLCSEAMVPTHNSTLSSGVALYMTGFDNEGGAEVYAAATGEKQARIVFDDAANMVRKLPSLKKIFGVYQDNIHILASASKFEPVAANASLLDGLNPHCVIMDEVHAHRTRALYDVMKSAMGARSQPMLWQITTAGFNLAGIGYEQHQYLCKILEGSNADDSFFGIIYSLDEGDDWTNPEIWRKANPNFGVSVHPDYLESFCLKAKDTPSNLTNFLTKHLCKWVNADVAWMNMDYWHKAKQTQYTLEDFEHEPCWMGMDLASRDDVASVALVFKRDGKYYSFGKHYLPADLVEERAHSTHAHYSKWAYSGQFTLTDGDTTDYGHIRDDILELAARFHVQSIGYDRYNATQLVSELQASGLHEVLVEIPQSARELSDPMKEAFSLIKTGRLLHDGNEAMTWMVSNVACHEDRNENIFPVKSARHLKIDGAVALILAIKRAILAEANEVSVYMTEERSEGFLVF